MSKLLRANKVTVKPVEDGFSADFYKTHKHILSVISTDTEWKAPDGMTKTGERESFRAYIIENAESQGIEWKPQDMRSDNLKMNPRYTTDDELIADVIKIVSVQFNELVEKCKYGVVFKGITTDEIVPMTETNKGTSLNKLGIVDGKYKNSGNWAWANIKTVLTVKFKKSEVYVPFDIELVSGQIRKPKIGIQLFTTMIHDEIINAGLATHEELEPPKEVKPIKEDTTEQPVIEEQQPVAEKKPKRTKRSTKSETKSKKQG